MLRSGQGVTLVETVGIMSIMLPILMTSVLVVGEVSHSYAIKQGLLHAARQAARSMVSLYDESPMIAKNRSLQDALVYNKVRVMHIVNASAQFDTANFAPTAVPPTVTVTVRYTSGRNGLMQFPLFDPLNMGSAQISASATYPLY